MPWGKRPELIVVLDHPRYMWLQYYERQTMPVVTRGRWRLRSRVSLGALRASGRPDEGRDRQGWPSERLAQNRGPEVPAVQRTLGVPDPGVPPLTAQTKDIFRAPTLLVISFTSDGQASSRS